MADILIRGIGMPKEGQMLYIDIYPDGKVAHDFDLSCKQIATAVPVPPHGRLVDIDAIDWDKEIDDTCDQQAAYELACRIQRMPTVIPANKTDCENCEIRKAIARAFDLHWLGHDDCPVRCPEESEVENV